MRTPPVAKEVPVDVGPVPCRNGDAEANEEEVDEVIQMLESKLMCTKGHRSKGKWESSRGTPTPLLTCLPTGIETLSVNRASRQR